jgi:hypothetical protein
MKSITVVKIYAIMPHASPIQHLIPAASLSSSLFHPSLEKRPNNKQ